MSEADSPPRKDVDLTKEVKLLNSEFRKNTPAYEVLDTIRKFPRPILVDFNDVLTNNKEPLQLNPDAPEFLQHLEELGNVFILTTAPDWEGIQQFMEESGIWTPNIVLMNAPSWFFITQQKENLPEGKTLRTEYLETVRHLGWDIAEEDLIDSRTSKRVAPIFNKPWKIPIIDDASLATENNPGILGIQVKVWGADLPTWLQENSQDKHSLTKAVEIVRQHYSKLFS